MRIVFRHTALSAAIAGVLFSPIVSAATSTAELANEVEQLKETVKRLEEALAAQQKAEPAPASKVDSAALEQKVKVLERKQEIAEEEAAKKKKEAPNFKAGEKGFAWTSADGDFELKLRGYVQADGRFSIDDDPALNGDLADTFLLRRVRPIFEGTVWKHFGFRVMPDFDGGTGNFTLQDAYIDVKYLPEASLRVGKFKGPIGLERLQSATDLAFVERGLPTNLVPNRDIGVQLYGDLFDGALSYAGGYFNGVVDRGSSNLDTTDDKEFAGRIFAHPFKNLFGPLQGLGIGIAGSYGDKNGASDVGNFVDQVQVRFFSFSDGTVASGTHTRIAPQGYYYWGPLGLFGEYVVSSQQFARGANQTRLDDEAWQLIGSWVLTGEDNGYKGIKPKRNFDPFNGGWGAFVLNARYGELDVDDDAFVGINGTNTDRLANPTSSATKAAEWGVGLNWHLNPNLKLYADYEQTKYDGGRSVEGVDAVFDRETEKTFFTRVQVSY
jgi:phosphate-selective porin OprO/OprP